MLQKKLFSLTDDPNLSPDYSEMECSEHNLPKKYYAADINQFFCEHDEQDSETVHFRLILDKYREDIKKIKNLSSGLTENKQIKEAYNSSTLFLQKLWDLQDNLGKQISAFSAATLNRIYSLITQEQEIFRLKDLIESIKFLPDGRADYIGIGANAIREKNYLNLAKILIERNIYADDSNNDKNNVTFQILKFLEQLQNFLVLFVDESYVFIKYIFDNLLKEVAKIEGNKVDINYINNFALYFIHREEYNKLSEKFNSQLNEINQLKSKISQSEKENAPLRKEAKEASQERDVLVQKVKDDKNTIDSLKLKNQELTNELNSLRGANNKMALDLESANNRMSEYSLTIKNSSLAIDSLKTQLEERLNKLKNYEKSISVEYERNKNLENENNNLKIRLENLEKMLKQMQMDINAKNTEIHMLRENHDNELSMATDEVDNLQKTKEKYQAAFEKLQNDLLEEKKKYSELKINLELKANENQKKIAALEDQLSICSKEKASEISKLNASLINLEKNFGEAKQTIEKLRSELRDKDAKLLALAQTNQSNANLIAQLESEISALKESSVFKSELSKLEEKIGEQNSLIFDLKCLNTALNRKITDLESALEELEKKAKLSTSEKDALSVQYRDLLAQYNSIVNDSGKKRSDEDRRIIDISIRLGEVTKLYEADQKKIKEFDNLMKQEREKFQQSIFILEKQVKDLNLIIQEHHKTKDYSENELSDERKRISLLIAENQSLLEKNKSLMAQNEQIQSDISEVNNLRTQIEEFRIQLHSQLKQNEILAMRLEEVERELRAERQKAPSATPKSLKMASDLKTQFDALFIQKEKLEKELIEKKSKITQLQVQNEALRAKADTLNADLASLKEQKNSLANSQAQIKNYISQLDEANKHKAKAELENLELRNKLDKALLELEQLKLAGESNAVLMSKLREEINEARKSEKKIELLSNSKMEIEKLKNKLEKSDSERYSSVKKFMSGSVTVLNNNSNNLSSNIGNNSNTFKAMNDPQEYLTLQKANSATAPSEFGGVSDARELVSSAPSVKLQRESINNLSNFNNNTNNINNSLQQNRNSNLNNFNNNKSNSNLNVSFTNIDFSKYSPPNLLLNPKHWGLIKEWFAQLKIGGSAKVTLDLLMKASRDGFSWEVFRDRCHRKSPTLVVLQTSFDKLIGGFTPLPWNQSKDQFQYLKDDSKKSFLFSLTNGRKYNIKNYQFAICNGNQIGPIFGGGSDLEIVHNCNENFNNFSAIGHTYEFSETPEAFYGGLFYTVKDYEVYEVKY